MLKQSIVCLTLVILVLLTQNSHAAEKSGTQKNHNQQTEKPLGNEKEKRWAVFPVISSEDETSWQFGVFGMHFFPKSETITTRPKIEFCGIMSVKKQIEVSVSPDIWFNKDKDHLTAEIEGKKWPSSVYAIGQDSPDSSQKYEANIAICKVEYAHRFVKGLSAGVHYRYMYYSVDNSKEGILAGPGIVGRDGGNVSGLGLSVSYDTRNHKVWPTKGTYLSFRPQFNYSFFGSEFNFSSWNFKARRFVPVFGKSVIGVAGQLNMKRGNIPFFNLSKPDGAVILRGINSSRYRDRDFIGGQVEYRSPFLKSKKLKWFGPVAFTAFAEAGQVTNKLSDLKKDQFMYSVGVGYRYCVVRDELINFRMDFSYVDNGFGFLLEFEEAF